MTTSFVAPQNREKNFSNKLFHHRTQGFSSEIPNLLYTRIIIWMLFYKPTRDPFSLNHIQGILDFTLSRTNNTGLSKNGKMLQDP
jgi:hypothetical protein